MPTSCQAGGPSCSSCAIGPTLALAVSAYNARELEALGYRDVRISPLPVDVAALCALKPDAATVQALGELDGPLVLYVGQLLPHKRPDLLLQAYHVLTTYLRPDAHLALLGPARLEAYHKALQTFSSELNLNQAKMTGWLTPEQLAAYYAKADLFVTMSEHEGFCVPLLEAMAFDVPVVARAFGAIPDTMGDAGLLLPPGEDPCPRRRGHGRAVGVGWAAGGTDRARAAAAGRLRRRKGQRHLPRPRLRRDEREPAEMTTSVIVVSYRLHRWLEQCLASVVGVADEVILVDNGSPGETVAAVGRRCGASVHVLPKNLGFACGVNAGLRKARGDVVALLNDDAVADPKWPATAASALADPTIAAVGPKITLFRPCLEVSIDDEPNVFPPDLRPLGRQLRRIEVDGVDVPLDSSPARASTRSTRRPEVVALNAGAGRVDRRPFTSPCPRRSRAENW